MMQAFYSGSVTAQQQMQRLGVTGNNIANVNTNGFKAQNGSFDSLLYTMVEGADGQLPRSSGARLISAATDFSGADLQETGRPQDYAIVGEGFFALRDCASGELSYTRDGAFTPAAFREADETGVTQEIWYLSDGEGRQVLDGAGQPIPVTDPAACYPVGVFEIQYRDGMERVGSSRFLASAKNGGIFPGASEVRQGMLESSNTDLAAEMGKVIEAQRAYGMALRVVSTADEIAATVNGLTT